MSYRHVLNISDDEEADAAPDHDSFDEPTSYSPAMDNRLNIHSHRWSRKRQKFVAKERSLPYHRYYDIHTQLCPNQALIVN